MQVLIGRRLLQAIPALIVVATIIFFVFTVVPGDPALLFAGEDAPEEYVNRLRSEFGLDLPVYQRYVNFMTGLVRLDLGASYFSSKPVEKELIPKLMNSLELAVFSFGIAVAVGLSVGIISGAKHGTAIDKVLTSSVILGISIPSYWLALILIFTFGVRLGWLPFVGKTSWGNYVLPAITMSVFSTAFIARMTRSFILESLYEDYVRTARAKGLVERVVLFKHVLRNALVPIVTILGIRFGYLLGGSVIIETIFAWPGMGYQFVSSVMQRDYPTIRGIVILYALQFILINLVVDMLYAVIDPRVRYG